LVSYRRAIQIQPSFTEALIGEGDILRTRGDSLGAVVAYRQAIRTAPQNPQAYYQLGLALLDRDRRPEAITQFQQARQLYEQQGNKGAAQKVTAAIKQLE
jgi:Flp pilus assembly protein TadD